MFGLGPVGSKGLRPRPRVDRHRNKDQDSHALPSLLHRNETRLYGEGAYRGNNERRRLSELAPNARDFTNKRVHQRRPLIDADRATNQRKSAVRS